MVVPQAKQPHGRAAGQAAAWSRRRPSSGMVAPQRGTQLGRAAARHATRSRRGPMATLSRITHFVLDGCARLEDLAPLGASRALRCVDLFGANRVRDLAPLAACAALEDLLISQSNASDLAPSCRSRSLAFVNCPRVEDLSPHGRGPRSYPSSG